MHRDWASVASVRIGTNLTSGQIGPVDADGLDLHVQSRPSSHGGHGGDVTRSARVSSGCGPVAARLRQ